MQNFRHKVLRYSMLMKIRGIMLPGICFLIPDSIAIEVFLTLPRYWLLPRVMVAGSEGGKFLSVTFNVIDGLRKLSYLITRVLYLFFPRERGMVSESVGAVTSCWHFDVLIVCVIVTICFDALASLVLL